MNIKTNINNLSSEQKLNYVKNLLFNKELTDALDVLLVNEKKDIGIIKIIASALDDELIVSKIRNEQGLKDNKSTILFVYSKILSILAFYNKNVIIGSFFKSLSGEQIKDIAIYEYQNKTNVSFSNKTFNKYCSKYKDEALNLLKNDENEVLMLTMEMEKYNLMTNIEVKKKKKKILPRIIICLIIIILISMGYFYYDSSRLIKKHDGLFLPGIYLNEVNLTGKKITDLQNILEKEKQKISNGRITVTNSNGDYKFTYEQLNIKIDLDSVKKEIEDYNDNLSMLEKIRLIKSNKKNKVFYLNGDFDEDSVNNFINVLKEKINVEARNDSLVVDENNVVYYDKGADGFTLDEEKTKKRVKETLSNLKEESVIEASGEVVKHEVKNEHLSSINTKISSYTTYFANVGNRGHNINLASSRLNNTIIMPGETFSYLKVVGPYGASNGYLPAPIYLNGIAATANGGGVCQLASTLYMAQLKAGLETVSRRNHTFAPTYVPKGLDATVYSTTTDYKFKNQYEFPIYIVSYVKGDYLTVDIWSNENALEGKTYEPYSVYSNGGYLAYLKTIKDGKVIETKYLDKSVYKAH